MLYSLTADVFMDAKWLIPDKMLQYFVNVIKILVLNAALLSFGFVKLIFLTNQQTNMQISCDDPSQKYKI